MSNELNGEKQAIVQRSLTVLSQRAGDDIASALLLSCLRVTGLLLHQELDNFLVLLCRHGVDPEKREGTGKRGW